jgi:serine/threonine protein kinase
VTSELSFPRQFGEYVLVAQLGDDGLGTVYRALHSSDEKRFMRLRVLQSPELLPESVCAAIRNNSERATAIEHKTIVLRPEMGIFEGVPFMAWYESAGWTLDVVLAKLRAMGRQIPVEYALLITERAAAAVTHAWFAVLDGVPFHHGLLWPGFISISNEAEVRVGGFGLAEAVLPALNRPRLLRDIAPYVAPEVRTSGKIGENSDVYSLGVLLLELLTCRRATLDRRLPELRSSDSFSTEVGACLRQAFADPAERFSSVVQMHRALQELLASNPYALSTASFGIFLYNLLNPESQSVPMTDAESTNPVEIEIPPSREDSFDEALADSSGPFLAERRKRAMTPLLPSTTHDQNLPLPPEQIETAPAPGSPVVEKAAPPRPPRRTAPVVKPVPTAPSVPTFSRKSTLALPPTPPRQVTRWAVLVSAAAVTLVVGMIAVGGLRSTRPAAVTPAASVAAAASPIALAPEPTAPLPSAPIPAVKKPPSSFSLRRTASRKFEASPVTRIASAASVSNNESARRSAGATRLGAALARIDAERVEASQLAADAFSSGRSSEKEGERLFAERDWTAAQDSFQRAAALFREAQNAAHEERVRRVKLVPADSPR